MRVTTVLRARKDVGKCSKCGTEIKRGDGYRWWKFRYGSKYVRCSKPDCAPRPADLTQSEYMKQIYELQEFKFSETSVDDLDSDRSTLVGDLEALRDEQEEKKSNMPEQLQESSSGEMLQERYDNLDSVISDLEAVDLSELDDPEKNVGETDEEYEARKEELTEEHVSSLVGELADALGNLG
jgi:hypothetical protein